VNSIEKLTGSLKQSIFCWVAHLGESLLSAGDIVVLLNRLCVDMLAVCIHLGAISAVHLVRFRPLARAEIPDIWSFETRPRMFCNQQVWPKNFTEITKKIFIQSPSRNNNRYDVLVSGRCVIVLALPLWITDLLLFQVKEYQFVSFFTLYFYSLLFYLADQVTRICTEFWALLVSCKFLDKNGGPAD